MNTRSIQPISGLQERHSVSVNNIDLIIRLSVDNSIATGFSKFQYANKLLRTNGFPVLSETPKEGIDFVRW